MDQYSSGEKVDAKLMKHWWKRWQWWWKFDKNTDEKLMNSDNSHIKLMNNWWINDLSLMRQDNRDIKLMNRW
jgi:hypothetical protein